ncbi:galactarate dehydratase [Kushneria sinocarnis]|uniref:Galactarate dehydratase n=1 Tax=Kushneria sinocarnis TaxID=595502 RepID=A0A420WTD1_9GAMM|nr:galactarate dehydratase [Kushneria sinocarnis]RKQ96352.1 galactarate dehydratase [Kushneria sinocarnis]
MSSVIETDRHQAPLIIRINELDNVAIVANDGGLPAGTELADGPPLTEWVPQGHKVALQRIEAGEAVVRYGVAIGYARQPLAPGCWVHEGLLEMPASPQLDNLPMATTAPPDQPPLEGHTFMGYRNADGSVGTRNILGITTTVQCVASVLEHAVERIRREVLAAYPNVDDVVALNHTYGCGVAIDAPDAPIPIRTVRNLARNPNLGGQTMVVSLGCEKLQPDRLLSGEGFEQSDAEQWVVRLQEHQGFGEMLDAIVAMARQKLAVLNERRREPCPLSGLVVGVQCGGSDAFSGVTANPAIGHATDLLVRAGATVLFSEVTEVRDGIHLLTARAANRDVARQLIEQMAWYDDYLAGGGVDRSANTTPGNKRGGLSNIVEKALGSIVKSGTQPISGVIPPGERVRVAGLSFAATPASDFICGTLQLAAGMNVHMFSTGRGTPYGLAMAPVLKVATRNALAQSWHDLMDINAGQVAMGEASIEEVGRQMFESVIATASGRRTWTERWGLKNDLALFNPAPVT